MEYRYPEDNRRHVRPDPVPELNSDPHRVESLPYSSD
jgi:hypothetical protein